MVQFMLASLPRRAGRAALIMSAVMATAVPAHAQYGGGSAALPALGAGESPEAALARNVRLLATNPRNFTALVAAGHAALGTGDTQAAAGFFGRAEEISPRSWQPKAGMGAAMVAMGDPQGALAYFDRAQALGATQLQIAVDRGLAFDLMGDQARAQIDYRVAMHGALANDARRRLALSLAISRDIKGAAAAIEPLLARRDPEALRINAFVLALAGDREGARRTIDAVMPGAGSRFEPFFKVLPVLRASEKAAAVHLGIFPKDAAQRYAQAEPVPISPVVSLGNSSRPRIVSTAPAKKQEAKRPVKLAEAPRRAVRQAPPPSTYMSMVRPSLDPSRYASTRRPKPQPATPTTGTRDSGDADPEPRPAGRIDDIARSLSESPSDEPLVQIAEAQPPEPAPAAAAAPPPSRPKLEAKAATKPDPKAARLAAEKKARADAERKKAEADRKVRAEAAKLGVAGTNWVQLAGGSNSDRMASEYKKLAAKAGALLKSRPGYVTQGKDYFRLLIGPFDDAGDAQDFVTKLDKAGIDSFRWTRTPAQIRIEKLKT